MSKKVKNPPFTITKVILDKVQEVAKEIGLLEGAKLEAVPVRLRRENRIRTIHSSLAIEGNTLSIDQVSHIFDNKRVIGPKQDIIEVNNAIKVYENLNEWNPLSQNSFKKAHKILMDKLTSENGKWRDGNVGVFKGKEVAHMAPPAKRVPNLMDELFEFIKINKDYSWLIKACIFHYELEFIHPFADGNGRMGRLWQQLLLMKENAVFEYISVEELIKQNQKQYYDVLAICDREGESTAFVEFSLTQILDALKEYSGETVTSITDPFSRIEFAKDKMGASWFSRKDYILLQKNISSATASRDLLLAVQNNILEKEGEANQVRYRFL